MTDRPNDHSQQLIEGRECRIGRELGHGEDATTAVVPGHGPPKKMSNRSFPSPQLHLEWVLSVQRDNAGVTMFAKTPVVQAAVVTTVLSKWLVPICGHHRKIPNASFQLLIAAGLLPLGQHPDTRTLCYPCSPARIHRK